MNTKKDMEPIRSEVTAEELEANYQAAKMDALYRSFDDGTCFGAFRSATERLLAQWPSDAATHQARMIALFILDTFASYSKAQDRLTEARRIQLERMAEVLFADRDFELYQDEFERAAVALVAQFAVKFKETSDPALAVELRCELERQLGHDNRAKLRTKDAFILELLGRYDENPGGKRNKLNATGILSEIIDGPFRNDGPFTNDDYRIAAKDALQKRRIAAKDRLSRRLTRIDAKKQGSIWKAITKRSPK